MGFRRTCVALLPWVFRVGLAIAVLATPFLFYWAFSEPDEKDPVLEQRLREAREAERLRESRERSTREPRPSTSQSPFPSASTTGRP
ncbi:MAG TPA: hypothetical protein VKE40_11945 [Gemmataceae bacterium]|nr:hypothetical protein [Gemmataceae bacterium]